jgi:hypothetical protein
MGAVDDVDLEHRPCSSPPSMAQCSARPEEKRPEYRIRLEEPGNDRTSHISVCQQLNDSLVNKQSKRSIGLPL